MCVCVCVSAANQTNHKRSEIGNHIQCRDSCKSRQNFQQKQSTSTEKPQRVRIERSDMEMAYHMCWIFVDSSGGGGGVGVIRFSYPDNDSRAMNIATTFAHPHLITKQI